MLIALQFPSYRILSFDTQRNTAYEQPHEFHSRQPNAATIAVNAVLPLSGGAFARGSRIGLVGSLVQRGGLWKYVGPRIWG